MRKHVVQSTCDSCGKEAQVDLPPAQVQRGQEFILPDGWATISANTRTKLLFTMDLCDECIVPLAKSAGVYTRTKRKTK